MYDYRIFGLDFTSTPSARKPITCATCTIKGTTLHLDECRSLATLDDFDAFLRADGPWLAALDFPFGQPRALIEQLGWPTIWCDYMKFLASMDKTTFVAMLQGFMNSQPPGAKLLLRATDILASARSPMMLHRVPVGKMFFGGATRLFRSSVSVLPCRPTSDNRVAIEGYPVLVARRLIGKRSYKSDERGKQTREQVQARHEIVHGLRSALLMDTYGLAVEMSDDVAESLAQDAMGDRLDAVLCALQAGWAYLERGRGYGISKECDKDEGWIVDPL
ncbi:MAG TPA: DUF429 domain-containing protein [Ktedonobacteraceae bacterium]|nr:DUF429 domain-containing protein [Ktedonobacteraceae bacterium]